MLVDRISLVKKPANRRRFVLYKADKQEDDVELLRAVQHHLEALTDLLGPEELKKLESNEDAVKQIAPAMTALKAFYENLTEVVKMDEELEKKKLTYEERQNLSPSDFAWVDEDGKGHLPIHDAAHVRNALARFSLTEFPDAATKKKALRRILAAAKRYEIEYDEKFDEMAKMEGEEMPEVRQEQVAVAKEEFEALVSRLAKAEEEAKAAREAAAQEREARITKEYEMRAAAYKHLGIPLDELVKVMKALDAAQIEWQPHFERIEKQLGESTLLHEVGKAGEGISERTEFEALVEAEMAKVLGKSTEASIDALKAEAIQQVARQRPDLYEVYRNELLKEWRR
ncbi:MAG: hypothetical protein QW761_01425 [Candidatus Aenigmatarchaeota archaeon]